MITSLPLHPRFAGTVATGLLSGLLASALPSQASENTAVTFTEHVAKIVFENCTACHRPGELAPFPLTNYREVNKRARMIARVVESRHMPPWPPARGDVPLRGARILSDDQIATIRRWIDGGRIEGPATSLPRLPEFVDGWQLGTPDLVIEMPKGFEVYASGRDLYRSFVIPLDLDEDKWVRAFEVRPSKGAVLHHTILRYDTTGRSRELDGADGRPGFDRGMGLGLGGRDGRRRDRNDRNSSTFGSRSIGGWAVGRQPQFLPLGTAAFLPKGADLVLNSHLHPNGKAEVEKTKVGLWFAKQAPERTLVGVQLPPFFGRLAGIDIPPGQANFEIADEYVLPIDTLAVGVSSHAHYIAKTMRLRAKLPDGSQLTLLDIPDGDFDWQGSYLFEKPVELPKGTKLSSTITYDNSSKNPNQQFDPPRRVRFGPQSTDEMGSITLRVVAKQENERRTLRRGLREHIAAATRKRLRARRGRIDWVARVRGYDKSGNDNGTVEREEVPSRLHRAFDRMDANGDGRLDVTELERLQNRLRRRER